MILLHRRGTTAEWQQADSLSSDKPQLLLKDGELAIEELQDGSRRVKIGDGTSKFADLPYVDEYTYSELTEKLTSLETSITARLAILTQADATTAVKIEDLKKQIKENLAGIEKGYADADIALRAELLEEFSSKLAEVSVELAAHKLSASKEIEALTAAINRVDTSLSARITSASADLDSRIAKLELGRDSDNESVSASINGILTTINTISKDAAGKFTSINEDISAIGRDVEAIKKSTEDAITEVNTKIDTVASDKSKDIKDLSDKVDGKEAELLKIIAEKESALVESIEYLSETSTTINKNLDTLKTSINTSIDTIKVDYANRIDAAIASADDNLDKLKKDTEDAAADLLKHVDEADSKNEEALTALDELCKSHFATTEEKFSALEASVEGLEAEDEELSAYIEALGAALSDLRTEVTTEITTIKQTHGADHATISNKLAESIKEHRSADIAILDALAEHVSSIYAELADLVDDDLILLDKISRLENTFADIKEAYLTTLVKLEEAVDTVKSAEKNLNDFRNSTESTLEEHANSLTSHATRLGTVESAIATAEVAIATAEAAIEQNTENIGGLQGRADDLQRQINTSKEELEGRINTNSTNLTTLTNSLEAFKKETSDSFGAVASRIDSEIRTLNDSMQEHVTTINNSISEAESKINTEEATRAVNDAELDKRISKLETFFNGAYDDEGNSLDAALDTLVEIQEYISSDGEAAKEMLNRIAGNETAITALNGIVGNESGGIVKDLADARSEISKQAGLIDELTEELAELDDSVRTEIPNLKAVDDTLLKSVDAAESAIKANNEGIASLRTDVDSLTASNTGLVADVAGLRTDLTVHQEQSAESISALELSVGTRFDAVNQRQDYADDRIDALENFIENANVFILNCGTSELVI